MGETIHATAHFKVDPGVAGNLVELVLIDELRLLVPIPRLVEPANYLNFLANLVSVS